MGWMKEHMWKVWTTLFVGYVGVWLLVAWVMTKIINPEIYDHPYDYTWNTPKDHLIEYSSRWDCFSKNAFDMIFPIVVILVSCPVVVIVGERLTEWIQKPKKLK